jgi:hypothetical protein
MSNITREEIDKLLQEKTGEEYYNGFNVEEIAYKENENNLPYILEQEDQHGGEGEGDDYWFIFSIAKEDAPEDKTYIKFSGFYDSWNGTEWDEGFSIVKPVEVKCIEWQFDE